MNSGGRIAMDNKIAFIILIVVLIMFGYWFRGFWKFVKEEYQRYKDYKLKILNFRILSLKHEEAIKRLEELKKENYEAGEAETDINDRVKYISAANAYEHAIDILKNID